MQKGEEEKSSINYKTDPKYVLVDLDIPTSFIGAKPNKKPSRKDYTVPDARIFEISDFISLQECKILIEQTEALGYKDIEWEYTKDYRDCKRILTKSQKFADELFNRLLPLLIKEDINDMRPFGFGNGGVWRPISVNECIRFTKYEKGQHFQPHRDGAFVRTNEERSVYTIMIYLNEEFTGGKTKFFTTTDRKSFKEEATVIPACGKALIFNHDVWHEGEQISEGVKYILRTDIMFKRVEADFSVDEDEYKKDPLYKEAKKYYEKSIQLQLKGDPQGSTKYYLMGLDIQAKMKSVGNTLSKKFYNLALDSTKIITSYLSTRDLINCLKVCKAWKRIFRDSEIWKQQYKKTFVVSDSQEQSSVTKDWYVEYRERIKLEKTFEYQAVEVKCRDIMTNKGFCWMPDTGESIMVGEEAQSIFDVSEVYNSYMGVNREEYYELLRAVITRGFPAKGETGLLSSRITEPNFPVLLAVNDMESFLKLIITQIQKRYEQLYMWVANSAIFGLLAKGFTEGVVVSVGYMHVRVSVVVGTNVVENDVFYEQKKHLETKTDTEIQEEFFNSTDDHKNIAKLTERLIKKAKQYTGLWKHIVLVGVPSLRIKDMFTTEIRKLNEEAKVHTWDTVKELEEYVIMGAKEACKLPNYRSFFVDGEGRNPQVKKKKEKSGSTCRNQ